MNTVNDLPCKASYEQFFNNRAGMETVNGNSFLPGETRVVESHQLCDKAANAPEERKRRKQARKAEVVPQREVMTELGLKEVKTKPL